MGLFFHPWRRPVLVRPTSRKHTTPSPPLNNHIRPQALENSGSCFHISGALVVGLCRAVGGVYQP